MLHPPRPAGITPTRQASRRYTSLTQHRLPRDVLRAACRHPLPPRLSQGLRGSPLTQTGVHLSKGPAARPHHCQARRVGAVHVSSDLLLAVPPRQHLEFGEQRCGMGDKHVEREGRANGGGGGGGGEGSATERPVPRAWIASRLGRVRSGAQDASSSLKRATHQRYPLIIRRFLSAKGERKGGQGRWGGRGDVELRAGGQLLRKFRDSTPTPPPPPPPPTLPLVPLLTFLLLPQHLRAPSSCPRHPHGSLL